jgi:hypothetical protein
MNRILQAPETPDQKLEPTLGSGRYYARFSQRESNLSSVTGGSQGVWLFEAFDADWFDKNLEPQGSGSWIDYYEKAFLFVLEIIVVPSQLGPNDVFSRINDGEKDDDELNEWFLIIVSPTEPGHVFGEGETPIFVYSNLYLPGLPAVLKEITAADATISERLRKAVSTEHIPDADDKDVDNTLGKLRAIEYAVVYDVGQGNAIGLCNSRGSVEAYFDLGGGVTRNAFTFPVRLKRFCFTNKPPIILSHWDFDHWSSANRFTASLRSTWIAPRQSVGPTHVALMARIQSSSTLLLLPRNFKSSWRKQIYIESCTGKGRNHSGVALTVSEKPGGSGQQMFFPGDASYTKVPSFAAPNGYLSVVAPHHGADMGHRIAPSCLGLAASRLVYSYGAGNSFNHPRHLTRTDHDSNGWRDPNVTPRSSTYEVRETANRLPGLFGHVYLGWYKHPTAPRLPCGSGCDLQAQQM